MMMVPIGMQAVNDIYLIGTTLNNNNWDAKGSHKFTYDGGTNQATITLPASTLSGGTDNNTVYLALWVDQGTQGYRLRPQATTVLAFGSGSVEVKSLYSGSQDNSVQLNSVSNSSDKEYVITLSNCAFSGNDMSSCDVSVVENTIQTSGGGGGTTTEAAYYLVGNFMNGESDINYSYKIFRMKPIGNSQYSFDIPATLDAKFQIVNQNGDKYGPQATGHSWNLSSSIPENNGTRTGNMTGTNVTNTSNYWNMTSRGLSSDGMYTVTITVDNNGVPTNWSIKHTQLTRVVYYLPKDGLAQPAYMTRNSGAAGDNKFFGNVYLNSDQECFVLGNIKGKSAWTDSSNPMPTVTKLYKQGNGGGYAVGDGTNPSTHPSGYDDWHKVYPALSSGFKVTPAGAMTLEYNPSKGQNEREAYSGNNNMGGEVIRAAGDPMDIIESMKVIGPGVGTDWTLSNAIPMTYNETLKCWEITITTTNAASTANLFRFVANDSWNTNWYEDGTSDAVKAKIPYTDSGDGHAATDEDPNVVERTDDAHTATARDIIFNRPAGDWTIRFYTETISSSGGNFFTYNYYYTITENTDPDATLTPGTDGGNYDFDNYTTGTPETETLNVTLSNDATKYAYAIGANSSVTLDESSTKTDGSFTLTYDGTKVTDGFNNEVTGNTVYIKIQGQDDSGNKGTTHTYQYTFKVSGGSTLDFTPKGGLFINSAKITVTGGTEPYTYTVKDASDASGKVLSTGNFVLDEDYPDGNYRISTPGYLTVTDALGNSKTSTVPFDFTYSTSENYKNYNNNATGSKIIQTGGGQGALNVFINKNDDLGTLWLYAYNKTLDTYIKGQGETDQDKIDKQVRLTDAFPGNDMTKAPTITIDGIKYVHFTIPEGNLREGDKVAIIVSQGNTQAENWWTQTTDAGVEIARTEDPAFIYNVKNVPATKADDSWNYKGANQLYQIAADGSRTIFFTKPDSWTEPIYCHAEDPSKPYCYFVDTNSWGSNLRIWAWDDNNGDKNYTGGTWPGATMTYVGDNGASGDSKRYVYRWEYSGNETGKPNKVKFSNNGSNGTVDLNFINGAIYNTSGLVKGNEEPTSDKMVLKEGNIYTFSVPVGSTKLYFYDANGNKTSVVTYSSDARNHYTWDGSTLNSTLASYAVDTEEYNKFLSTPPTTTVVTQRYPNGEDYWRAAPGDLSIKLDPTWGGKSLEDEATTRDWAGNMTKRVNATQMPLTQTIQGLNAGKTYTVQAIVRGEGENNKTVTLTLEGAETVTKTLNLRDGSGNSKNSADLSRQGSEITMTGRVEYIEPQKFEGMNKYTGTDAGGWAKVEATVKASQAGWLTISLTDESTDPDKWFDLSQVTLLEDANTDHGFRTTASTSATDTEQANVDFRDRSWKKNNAYSFFDRGKNRNAVVFADKRTVIAMDKSQLASECPNRDIDRRHPFNVVATNGASDTNGEASVLYLTDMGYGGNTTDYPGDADNPVDYDQTGNITGYSRSGYTFMPTLQFTASNVVMDRPIGNETKRQTTIMLPFAISQSELQTYYGNVEVWSYDSYSTEERKINFIKLTGDLVANTPYILTGAGKPNGGTVILDSRNNASSTAKTISAVTSTIYATAVNHSGFTGTYAFQTIQRGDANETRYGFNPSTGKFQIASYKGAALKPFRAYFTLPLPYEAQTSAPAYTVVFDDTITGISDTIQVEVEPTDVYTLGGVRVATKGDLSRLPKGVYIVNGKKVIK